MSALMFQSVCERYVKLVMLVTCNFTQILSMIESIAIVSLRT